MPNWEKFGFGRFRATPEEKKKNPDIEKKMAAANEALKRQAAEKARKKLRENLEQMPEEESEEEERMEKVA